MTIWQMIKMWYQKIMMKPHIPCNSQIARFIWWNIVTTNNSHTKNQSRNNYNNKIKKIFFWHSYDFHGDTIISANMKIKVEYT